VIRRTDGMMVLLNRYPYSNGHLMIAPLAHKANLADLSAAEMSDSMQLLIETQDALRACVHAQGFNIGMNVGPCAGAGVPDHLHWHVVPRWGGDTNYMSVVGDARVIPDALAAVYQSMRAWWANRDAGGSDAKGS
ncbi:MAG: HIT domain-containing protein, partial [Phycisphaerae bacterium]